LALVIWECETRNLAEVERLIVEFMEGA
jgi:hypothetical protein